MSSNNKEKQAVIEYYNKLKDDIFSKNMNSEELELVDKAFDLALEAHGDTLRKSGELYIYHPLEVAKISAVELFLDSPAIAAALLHDVVEDTDYGLDYIKTNFGEQIAAIVDGLTKISEENVNEEIGTNQTNTIKKIVSSLSYDIRVILVKLADRLHNLRTIGSMAHTKQAKIASETKFIYAPLALRLGYFNVKNELDDLCMQITDSDIYHFIKGKIEISKNNIAQEFNEFVYKISDPINRANLKVEYSYQIRSISSLWNTMNKRKLSFDELDFKYNLKIVIDCPENTEKFDCWRVYSIISSLYQPKPDSLKDWISTPKANGYESIHATFMNHNGQWTKVLIRSKRMDEIAEKGVAFILQKDIQSHTQTKLEQWISTISNLVSTDTENSIDFVDNFKSNLFTKEIFVYTPKGETRTLPQGATLLDFAFAISSQLGCTCAGGYINNKLSSISTELKSGDKVEILTSTNQHPKFSWLNAAKTPRAIRYIKKSLNELKRSYYDDGKIIVENWLKENKLNVNDNNIDKILKFSGEKNLTDLFYNVAIANIKMESFKRFIQPESMSTSLLNMFKPKKVTLKDTIDDRINNNLHSIVVSDKSDLSYNTCKHCNPIPGDDVVGISNPDGAIVIHRTNCEKAVKLMTKYGNRVIKAKWQKQDEQAGFLTAISLEGIDRKGLTIDITELIGKHFNLNIREISLKAADNIFTGMITLYISDTNALNMLISDLEKIDSIKKVTRINRAI